jgi:hypothetical protein
MLVVSITIHEYFVVKTKKGKKTWVVSITICEYFGVKIKKSKLFWHCEPTLCTTPMHCQKNLRHAGTFGATRIIDFFSLTRDLDKHPSRQSSRRDGCFENSLSSPVQRVGLVRRSSRRERWHDWCFENFLASLA